MISPTGGPSAAGAARPIHQGGVTHYLYEGQVSFQLDHDDGSSTVVLHDGHHDLGDELAGKLAFLFGAEVDGATVSGCRRLRILIEDLDDNRPEERHELDGDGIDTELVEQLDVVRELPYGAELLARSRRDWQYVCRKAIRQLRTAHLGTMAYEIASRQHPGATHSDGHDGGRGTG